MSPVADSTAEIRVRRRERRPDGDEHRRTARDGPGVRARGDPALARAPFEPLRDAGLLDRTLAPGHPVDDRGVDVDAVDRVAALGEHCRQRRPDVAEPDDRDRTRWIPGLPRAPPPGGGPVHTATVPSSA